MHNCIFYCIVRKVSAQKAQLKVIGSMTIHDLRWRKTSFLAKIQLFYKSRLVEEEKLRSTDRFEQAVGYSNRSEVYCHIGNSAIANFWSAFSPWWLVWLAPFRLLAWGITWLPLGAWCYYHMLPLSDKALALRGESGMSAEMFQIRQCILRSRRKYAEAKTCIECGLSRHPQKASMRGLLHAGLADIYLHEDNWQKAYEEEQAALNAAHQCEAGDPLLAAQIYRQCADVMLGMEEGDVHEYNRLCKKARRLAERAQVLGNVLALNT